jgi:hypothetical protein
MAPGRRALHLSLILQGWGEKRIPVPNTGLENATKCSIDNSSTQERQDPDAPVKGGEM